MNSFTIREYGVPIFEGNIDQVANMLKMTKSEIYEATNGDVLIKGKYTVLQKTEEEINQITIKEHLFNPDGSRRYQFKKAYPNRYKDASCVRFTPL